MILRYHNVYGPAMGWDHVVPQFISRLIRDEEFTVQGDGSQRRAFCYVDDAVAPTTAALTADAAANGIFNVGNPAEEHSINDLIARSRARDRAHDPSTLRAVRASRHGPPLA